jgi:hypothetical protein
MCGAGYVDDAHRRGMLAAIDVRNGRVIDRLATGA